MAASCCDGVTEGDFRQTAASMIASRSDSATAALTRLATASSAATAIERRSTCWRPGLLPLAGQSLRPGPGRRGRQGPHPRRPRLGRRDRPGLARPRDLSGERDL